MSVTPKFSHKYEDSLELGVARLAGRLSGTRLVLHNERLQLLLTGQGSRSSCLLSLSDDCATFAMDSYFAKGDLQKMKHWSYSVAKIEIMLNHLEPPGRYPTGDLMWPLISDNSDVIEWYRQHKAFYHPEETSTIGGNKEDPKNWMFYGYQSWLALNSRWDELGERCERILAMEAEIKRERAYLIDHRFYLALARGDKAGMESVLLEKCQPKNRKARFDHESGITNHFIVSYATLFAKLAWRAGYELDIDTPWIPKDWLPIKPLDKYEDPWPFMQSFDIWQPLPEPYAQYSPVRPTS